MSLKFRRITDWWSQADTPIKLNLNEKQISALAAQGRASDTPRQIGEKSIEQAELLISRKLPRPEDYWKRKYSKDLIVLHFTAGYTWRGAYETFRKPGRTATPFIVDADGSVYQLFDPEYWSHHIGITGRSCENYRHDRRSIGIEIVNIGPVWRRGGQWVDYTNSFPNINYVLVAQASSL